MHVRFYFATLKDMTSGTDIVKGSIAKYRPKINITGSGYGKGVPLGGEITSAGVVTIRDCAATLGKASYIGICFTYITA